jgi:hypothetical protein
VVIIRASDCLPLWITAEARLPKLANARRQLAARKTGLPSAERAHCRLEAFVMLSILAEHATSLLAPPWRWPASAAAIVGRLRDATSGSGLASEADAGIAAAPQPGRAQ